MRLRQFAYLASYEEKIGFLALRSPEKWSFGSNSDNGILKNYIEYTFLKLQDEKKVVEENEYSLFHTGLYTEHLEEIYAYFTPNKVPDKQKWFLIGFFTRYQLQALGVTRYPGRANYFGNPSDLVFDTNCEIIPNINIY